MLVGKLLEMHEDIGIRNPKVGGGEHQPSAIRVELLADCADLGDQMDCVFGRGVAGTSVGIKQAHDRIDHHQRQRRVVGELGMDQQ